MTAKSEDKKTKSNVININNFKKKSNRVTSTIENIELVAFEDALEELVDSSQNDNSKNSKNFVNDA